MRCSQWPLQHHLRWSRLRVGLSAHCQRKVLHRDETLGLGIDPFEVVEHPGHAGSGFFLGQFTVGIDIGTVEAGGDLCLAGLGGCPGLRGR